MLGVSPTCITLWETAHQLPHKNRLVNIAQALDVELEALMAVYSNGRASTLVVKADPFVARVIDLKYQRVTADDLQALLDVKKGFAQETSFEFVTQFLWHRKQSLSPDNK